METPAYFINSNHYESLRVNYIINKTKKKYIYMNYSIYVEGPLAIGLYQGLNSYNRYEYIILMSDMHVTNSTCQDLLNADSHGKDRKDQIVIMPLVPFIKGLEKYITKGQSLNVILESYHDKKQNVISSPSDIISDTALNLHKTCTSIDPNSVNTMSISNCQLWHADIRKSPTFRHLFALHIVTVPPKNMNMFPKYDSDIQELKHIDIWSDPDINRLYRLVPEGRHKQLVRVLVDQYTTDLNHYIDELKLALIKIRKFSTSIIVSSEIYNAIKDIIRPLVQYAFLDLLLDVYCLLIIFSTKNNKIAVVYLGHYHILHLQSLLYELDYHIIEANNSPVHSKKGQIQCIPVNSIINYFKARSIRLDCNPNGNGPEHCLLKDDKKCLKYCLKNCLKWLGSIVRMSIENINKTAYIYTSNKSNKHDKSYDNKKYTTIFRNMFIIFKTNTSNINVFEFSRTKTGFNIIDTNNNTILRDSEADTYICTYLSNMYGKYKNLQLSISLLFDNPFKYNTTMVTKFQFPYEILLPIVNAVVQDKILMLTYDKYLS